MYQTLQTLLELRNKSLAPRALFLAGPPGSGKSHVAHEVAAGSGAKEVNIDHIVEFLAKKQGADLSDADQSDELYRYARNKYVTRREHFIRSKYDLVIDGTGRDPNGIQRVKDQLEAQGYETAMLFVAVDLETSLKRNHQRERRLDSKYAEEAWHSVMRLVRTYHTMFDNFFYVRNEDGSSHEGSDSSKAKKAAATFIHKR